MFKKFDGIIVDEVICYEETVKMKLPKDYKEFLLDTNGGQFIDEIHMFWVDELKENIGIDVLFGFNQVRSLCLNSWYNETESKIIEIKENAMNSLEDYKQKYGSDAYGFVAYILNLVRIYSIPLCFLGIAIGAIHQYVIGIRKLDTLEKGMALIVSFVTILIICQILPLAFAVFVKFGRG